jgi:uncharacterized protein (TIGR01777 family)
VRVLISGKGGLIGTALSDLLAERGHEAVALDRGEQEGGRTWSIEERWVSEGALDGIDAVVHLSGKPIFPPFTEGRKRAIMDSRRIGTSLIAEAVAKHRPDVFISASAIGYYGSRGDEILTETSGPGSDFLADVVVEWEKACQPARDAEVRTVNIRSGLVMSDEAILIKLMALPFKLGLGGKLGSGRQWWSWITLRDEARAIMHCLEEQSLSGPVNLTAPGSVRNEDFADALGDVLNRPSAIPVPGFALKIALGAEAAEQLILASQRVKPEKLLSSGFEFEHPDIEEGLRAALSSSS